ncbi:MAG: FHA domain-containing protein [Chloroflexi bacterium]|nr:FHA domain-containing protein [Chloroflexota bacterium]
MSMDPMGGQSGYAPAGQQGGDGSGACGTCGRPLPAPDLEAVASGIDQTLSVETGKMVARTAWAGRAPDGMMDSLLSFMPGVKARRQLWERGQALWTERMTQAISGPCDACLGVSQGAANPGLSASPYGGQQPYQPTYQPQEYQPQGAGAPPDTPYGATSVMPGYGAPAGQPPLDDDSSKTAMVSPYTPSPPATEDEDNATSAVPAFLSHAAQSPAAPANPNVASQPPASAPPPPPAYEGDEHESHTVMLTVPPNLNLRGGPRLVVLEGPVHGRQFTLGRQLTTIGRSIGCHVTVEADIVGYDHARVVRGDGGWHVEPIGGAGETYVNDDLVTAPRSLRNGDVIRIGPARMRFESAG